MALRQSLMKIKLVEPQQIIPKGKRVSVFLRWAGITEAEFHNMLSLVWTADTQEMH